MKTIQEAKKYLRDNFEEGVDCPCCGQLVKRWREPLHSSQALWLIYLVRKYEQTRDYVHVKNINPEKMRGGDYAKLVYWDLIEPMPKQDDPSKRASGYWKPTEQGILFAKGLLRVKKYTLTYDKKLLGFEGDEISIQDALGKKFDFEELWK